MAQIDEKTQALIDKAAVKARKDAFKDAIAAVKESAPDTDGLDKPVVKALKDQHKLVLTALKDASAA